MLLQQLETFENAVLAVQASMRSLRVRLQANFHCAILLQSSLRACSTRKLVARLRTRYHSPESFLLI